MKRRARGGSIAATVALLAGIALAVGLLVSEQALSKGGRGGVTVVTDDASPNAWWRSSQLKAVKTQSDRVFYSLGKGAIVAYNRKIVDPSEHALDVIDIVGHPRRAVRIWNANSSIAVSSPGLVHLLNYSGRARSIQRRPRSFVHR